MYSHHIHSSSLIPPFRPGEGEGDVRPSSFSLCMETLVNTGMEETIERKREGRGAGCIDLPLTLSD
jgi:hypothetical protein